MMAQVFQSYKCKGCGKMIPTDAEHISANYLILEESPGPGASAWERARARNVDVVDEVFCTVDCVIGHIREEMTKDRRSVERMARRRFIAAPEREERSLEEMDAHPIPEASAPAPRKRALKL